MSESKHRRSHFAKLASHAATMIDNQTHGHRSVFLLEETDILNLPVLKNTETVGRQTRDEIAMRVSYVHRKRHQLRI